MVRNTKERVSITLSKETLSTLDNFVKRLKKENPVGNYTRSTVLEWAFYRLAESLVKEYEAQQNKKGETE